MTLKNIEMLNDNRYLPPEVKLGGDPTLESGLSRSIFFFFIMFVLSFCW
jgi:hypothetical protein